MMRVLLLFLLLINLSPLTASAGQSNLDTILSRTSPPPGVVIEIVTGDDDGLSWALPMARRHIERLRQRFADLPIALITHGREQFALTRNNKKAQANIHRQTRSLIQDSKVAVHVCGTFARWEGLEDEDFVEYVDVAAAGPAQINDYVALGYLKLVIRSSDSSD